MPANVQNQVVSMQFNGQQFLAGLQAAGKAVQGLDAAMKLIGANSGLDELNNKAKNTDGFDGLDTRISGVSSKLLALGTLGVTALANIANQAINTGVAFAKSLTVDPIMDGFGEYETKMGSIQTILANTSRHGTGLGEVTASLDELNAYADKTIYNFGDMTRNIGLFTNAGLKVEEATSMIKGFSNEAAASGTTSEGAAGAAYQLSQALSAGTIRLMDWRSLNTVGMGNKNMQSGIIEIAQAMGTFSAAGMDASEATTDFNGSLEKGWLSSEVMSTYLQIMAGDMDDAQMAALGLSQAQIDAFKKQQQIAEDAAKKVRTWTQLVGALKEAVGSSWAQTFDILLGDFNEATDFFTDVNDRLGSLILGFGESRNNLLQGWADLGGRTKAVEALWNIFDALLSVVNPIIEAFREIFPPMTADTLMKITENVVWFAASLILSESRMNNLKRTFKGLFAVLDIVWMVIKGVVSVLARLTGSIFGATGSVLAITGSFGDFLVAVRDAIKQGDFISKFFNVLGDIILMPVAAIKLLVHAIAGLFEGFDESKGDLFASALERIKERLAGFAAIGTMAGKVWEGTKKLFQGLLNWMQPLIDEMSTWIADLGGAIAEGMGTMDFDKVLDMINTGLFGGLILLIKKFMNGGFSVDFGGGMLESVKGAFEGLTETMSAMQQQLQAGTLMKIATAVALLTASVVALTLLDPGKMAVALGGITVMMTQLVGAMWLLTKATAGADLAQLPLAAMAMIAFAGAVLILAFAVQILGSMSWEDMVKGLVGVVVLLGAMVGVMRLMAGQEGSFIAIGFAMLILAAAIKVLVSAVTDLAGLSWEDLAKGLGGVAALMAALYGFVKLVGNPAGIFGTAAAMVIMGVAINILADAVGKFAAMSWDELARGMAATGTGMLIMVAAMKFLPPDMLVRSLGLIAMAVALNILATALGSLGAMSWEQIIKSLVALAGALAILAGAMYLMSGGIAGAASLLIAAAAIYILAPALATLGAMDWVAIAKATVMLLVALALIAAAMYVMTAALPGAAALLVVAVALSILAPVLVTLGSMSWEQIGKGLVMLAGAFAVIGIAGALLTPTIPTLLGLGAAIMLLGLGAMLAGAGILMLSIGLSALAVSGTAGAAALVTIITAIISLIPQVFQQIGAGIVAMMGVIEAGAPAIVSAIMAILTSLLTAVTELIPMIVTLAVTLISSLLDAIATLIPMVVDAGLRLIQGILQGIADNIGGIITAATDVVVNFLDGIAANLPRIIESGFNLIISFIEGLASSVRANSSRMSAAGIELANAIVDGMVNGIGGGVGFIVSAANRLAQSALDAIKSVLGIKSPSREMRKVGKWMDEGLVQGIDGGAKEVVRSSENLGNTALDTLKETFGGIADVVNTNLDMTPTITPVVDLSKIKEGSEGLSTMWESPSFQPKANIENAHMLDNVVASNRVEANAPAAQAGTNVNYVQNINSPKAISATEVYRNTSNQISSLKGVLSDNPLDRVRLNG